ncbi:MAG TPA: amidohydrolase family protein [Kofleriaceae bacterium]|nr:amidohydrolase family protein [Kofleriaceae bacterium]
MAQPVIDAWAQRPTQRFLDEPWLASLNRWTRQETLRTEMTVEGMVGHLEEAGVERALLCAWCGPKGWLISNDEVAAQCAERPDRFVGVASANLFEPMAGVRELRRCVKDRGFKALRIVPWLWGLPPDDRRYYPLYAECCELGIPFLTQIGHTGPLLSSEPGRPIPYLERVLLEFPELVVVGGHVGFPWMNEVLSLAYKFRTFYIDTSAYSAKRYPHELVDYLRGQGAQRVLFGSNYPMLTPRQAMDGLDALGLAPEVRTAFLHDNAVRVFKL